MQVGKQAPTVPEAAAVTARVPSSGPSPGPDISRQRSMEDMAKALEVTGEFRVLRKLRPRTDFAMAGTSGAGCLRRLAVLDVETTGLDPERDEVIELGMISAEYMTGGNLCRVTNSLAAFNEPSAPLPPQIVQLTGITDGMLSGHRFDSSAIEAFVADVDLVIAHNARFDRAFAEKYWPAFEHLPWACTATQLDWPSLGFDGARLGQLLAGIGLFHGAHRALDDCSALLELLAYRPATAPASVLAMLLDTARKPTRRIWAEHAPYDRKDRLRARGFRWNPGTDGRPRSWHREIEESAVSAELEYLNTEIYGRPVELLVQPVTAWSRFSARTG